MRYRSYCDALRLAWGDRDVPDAIDVTFYMPMPASWSKKKRDRMNGLPCQSKPDIDNLLKGFMDALLKDDARIWSVRASKIWSIDGAIEVGGIWHAATYLAGSTTHERADLDI